MTEESRMILDGLDKMDAKITKMDAKITEMDAKITKIDAEVKDIQLTLENELRRVKERIEQIA